MAQCFQLMLALALVGIALLPGCKAGGAQLTNSMRRAPPQGIVIADETKKQPGVHLRVCNAFTDAGPMELLHRPGHHHEDSTKIANLTSKTGLLSYKGCGQWSVDLRRGDSLEFRQGASHLGSFSVSAVPQWDTLLLLVIHHRKSSLRPAFASHVFAKTKSAQVAVLDMYQGSSKGHLAIQEDKDDDSARKLSVLSEELAYDSVVALDGGQYICKLLGGEKPKQVALNAVDGESYVAMRVGTGKSEEIVVFPTAGASSYNILGSLFLVVMVIVSNASD